MRRGGPNSSFGVEAPERRLWDTASGGKATNIQTRISFLHVRIYCFHAPALIRLSSSL
jgi:hypothetical protein